MMRTRPLLVVSALLLAGAATADEQTPQAKEIAELRKEVRELRAALRLMVDLDQQRVELVSRLLGLPAGSAGAGETGAALRPHAGAEVPPAEPAAPRAAFDPTVPASPPSDKVTLSGTVKVPGGGPAWVYVENAANRLVRGKTAELRQVRHQFEPRAVVVQQGTEVRFPNLDATYHNVFSNSPNASFDLGIYRLGDPPKSFVFNQPGVSAIYCNMHADMSAAVLVVPNSLFVQVAADGSYSLAGVPAGKRKVVAWTPDAEPTSKWVIVEPGQPATVNLELGAAEQRAHLDKKGKPYGSYQ